jgi:predicted transcriptional regulator of viral defense system
MHGMSDAPHIEPNSAVERALRDPAVEMAALATRQHGVVARWQLLELGLSRHVIAHLVKRGRLHPVHRGVYAVGHRRLTTAGRRMAAVLACGEGAVLSHRSAAALWGIRPTGSARIEISTLRHRRGHSGVVVHETELPADEVTVHDGIPVTTPARTLLDVAALLDVHRLARAAERAEALRLTSPTTLSQLLDRYPKRAGTPNIKRLIEEQRIVPTTTANDLERCFLSFLDANELPRPLTNESLDPNTTPDFRWPEQRLIVELDGFETHGTRQAFERDRARDRRLLASGWRVARITQRQLDDDPEAIAAELRAVLRSATTAAPAPPPDPRTRAQRSRPAGR